jgi:micrococcal nuclease
MKTKNFVISFLMLCVLILGAFLLEPEVEEIEKEEKIVEDVAGITQEIESELYEVIRVIDGDTIVVQKEEQQYKVRMIGIDTPESVHPSKPVEYFGIEAANKLKELIEEKNVILKLDETQDDIDRYGRLLRYVYLDNIDINLEMIKQGYAFEYTYRVPYEKQEEYKQAENFAKENELGLWKSQD